eukprot:TRINITY_DN10836_c0_g1_i1.p1 TRINITY_DN10836_c0_g1~~TRINITY_DN10836_c0_g1_i1.p1  ORF type:complete len:968 (+),score=396.11 TRINITY_DN10836_c0_g1_i1:101-2905(+)
MSRTPRQLNSTRSQGTTPRGQRVSTTSADLCQLPDRRVQEQTENARRVQRQKLERKFLSQISRGEAYKLGAYHQLVEEEHIVQQERMQIAASSPPRTASPRKSRRPPPPPDEPVRCVQEFSGSIRCLELAQGGATLWTGDNDGTISIRNGATGEIVHHIPSSGGLYADALYTTDTHMWVGMSDGTVRIYDHLVYILVSEAKFHSGSVTCFACTFDGKIFSGGTDSAVVKWDSEANNFERMAKMTIPGEGCIHAVTCYGYNLFVGGDDAVIHCLDTETGHELRRCEGHSASVRALLVQDGYLFSGSMDASVRVWNIEHAECIWTMGQDGGAMHTAGVTCLVGDQVAHRVWSADAESIIHIWDSTPDHDFAHRTELRHGVGRGDQPGPPVIGLRSFCTVDAIKLWSLAANGKNLIWSSAVNRVEDAVRATIDAMSGIINQDMAELRKWQELIRRLEAIDDRRKTEVAASFARVTCGGVLRVYYFKWLTWVHHCHHHQRRGLIRDLLLRSTHRGLLRRHYERWEEFAAQGKANRRKQATARGLLQVHTRGLQQLYWRKLRAYVAVEKHAAHSRRIAETLLSTTEGSGRLIAWRRWQRWRVLHARIKRREVALGNLMRCTNRGVLLLYYCKLRALRRTRKHMERRDRLLSSLCNVSERALLRRYWRLLLQAIRQMRRRKRHRLIAAEALMGKSTLLCRLRFYGLWAEYAHAHRTNQTLQKIAEAEAHGAELQSQFDAREAALARYKEIEDKRREVAEAQRKVSDIDGEIDAARRELEELRRQIEEKRQREREHREASKSKMVADFMALLKAQVLNYHKDYDTIGKLRDQVEPRGSVPVAKLFLEAHMVVKRVVVEITRTAQDPGQRWRGMDRAISQVQDHHKRTVLNAIKQMIICYDLMTEAVRNSLETDDEILANTDYLKTLAEQGRQLEEMRASRR